MSEPMLPESTVIALLEELERQADKTTILGVEVLVVPTLMLTNAKTLMRATRQPKTPDQTK